MSHSTMSISTSALHAAPPSVDAARTKGDSKLPLAEEIAVTCHELRNSLAVVRGAARLLRPSADSGALETARSLIERQADQMSRHIDDLLQPPRRNGHDHRLRLSNIDLCVIARDAVNDVRPEFARRAHRLDATLPTEPIRVRADAAKLEQALSNLLTNAAKYTPDGGDITLTVQRDRDLVYVRIRDSGIGIEPAMLTRIFTMFVQAESALPRAAGGCGIGLAVVRTIVELHGGVVRATSPGPGQGSEFIVALPALPA